MMKRSDGFTLIELIVVVLVIGILATIALPVFLGQRQKAHRSSAVADMKNAATAVETFAAGDGLGSYAAAHGADETSPLLDTEGFNPTQWVTLQVHASATHYCIQGENAQLPGRLFVFRSTRGVVDVLPDLSNGCSASLT